MHRTPKPTIINIKKKTYMTTRLYKRSQQTSPEGDNANLPISFQKKFSTLVLFSVLIHFKNTAELPLHFQYFFFIVLLDLLSEFLTETCKEVVVNKIFF